MKKILKFYLFGFVADIEILDKYFFIFNLNNLYSEKKWIELCFYYCDIILLPRVR